MKNQLKIPHRVSETEDPNQVMTVAQLRALLDTGCYPDNTVVMLSEDYITAQQILGFFTGHDFDTGENFIVLTTGENAQTELFENRMVEHPKANSLSHEEISNMTMKQIKEICNKQRRTIELCCACPIKDFCDKYLGRQGGAAAPEYWPTEDK